MVVEERLLTLGDGSVTLELHQGHNHTLEKLKEKFPKLVSLRGGVELLLYERAGEQSAFHQLKPPYTPSELKDVCGQAKIFIRPLQEDIEIEEEGAAVVEVNIYYVTENVHNSNVIYQDLDYCYHRSLQTVDRHPTLIPCLVCGEEVALNELCQHKEEFHSFPEKKVSC